MKQAQEYCFETGSFEELRKGSKAAELAWCIPTT